MSEPSRDRGARLREAGDLADVAARWRPRSRACWSSSAASRPSRAELEAEVRGAASRTQRSGALLVAEADGEIVGVLSASWQRAIHVPGRYATIQDLWVHPDWRSRGVGARAGRGARQRLPRERGVGAARGRPAARDLRRRSRATEAFYRANGFEHLGPRMRRLLLTMSELLMVEQRRGSGDAALLDPRRRPADRPGQDSNRRLVELRSGLVRHARVRAVAADADDEALERTLGGAARAPPTSRRLAEVDGGAGGDAGLRPARPGARHPGQRRPWSPPPARGSAPRSPPPSGCSTAPASPTPSAARPATTPAPPSSAATATSTTPRPRCGRSRDGGHEAGRDPRPRPPLPERHRGAGRADGQDADPALAARLAGHQRRRRHGAAADRARTRRRLRRQPRRRQPTWPRSRASIDDARRDRAGAGRLARLRHGRRRPARRLELLAGDLRRDRPPAGRGRACRSA